MDRLNGKQLNLERKYKMTSIVAVGATVLLLGAAVLFWMNRRFSGILAKTKADTDLLMAEDRAFLAKNRQN